MYIYHLIPEPFHGTKLIPLNQMDQSTELYKRHASKYEGREELMNTIIPKIQSRWNDVIHFSCIDPKIVAFEIKKIKPDTHFRRTSYFKIHISQILNYRPVIFSNNFKDTKSTFDISDDVVTNLTMEHYRELTAVPEHTLAYWERVNKKNMPLLWFAYMPHVFIKDAVDTVEFEIVEL